MGWVNGERKTEIGPDRNRKKPREIERERDMKREREMRKRYRERDGADT